ISACGNDDDVDLFNALGGNPQTGGVWTPLNGGTVTGNEFDATSVTPGAHQFRYVLAGILGCASDTAIATVNVIGAPFAGNDATLSICSNASSANMFTLLAGAQSRGTWSGPSSTSG